MGASRLVHREAGLVAGCYLLLGILWILTSDWMVSTISENDVLLSQRLQNVKGVFFVAVSGACLYLGTAWALNVRERLLVERHQLQNMLNVAQKLEGLGTMAATIAHDFNNVLSVVKINASLLAENKLPQEQIARTADEIADATDRGKTIIDQLMFFIRNRPSEMASRSIAAIVREIEPLLRRAATARNSFRVQLAEPLPEVVCDSTQVEQVLLNLTTNARDALEGVKSRKIELRVYAKSLDNHQSLFTSVIRSGEFVVVEMSDTGCGIPQENLTTVFSPFFTTKPEGKGTGLGLASTWRAMERHGGWVEVESKPKHGSTFRLYFPTQATANRQVPARAEKAVA